ncbi:MAG TPA: bifunctional diaminohydroxyphosphoribosylaminopyrimidine deaminase/5-amino-6-(5-phosphoribosylamino)uracil reductase RibD [Gaiellaceae bacterium]|nr:bifunctional diaminohydroxyphosphoribosylaminopyrimidine deaminase/5-amino-6-(5-phosphoribosylamino)uracil reductase RibD [Gaiellaceae bacterium]
MTDPLERALELAERGRGTTRPNPMVGAVVVRDGEVVGEGWHERAGLPHAERLALDAAGERARGATLVTTLEPCGHQGRTGPCADAVVEAGISRVVVGVRDPNPEAAGGIERLHDAGVQVELAEGEIVQRLRRQNETFLTWAGLGRPFVTYKAAMTLDGRVAAAGGDSRWISGPESRRRVHELRALADAVAVGGGTARADRPRLTAREVDAERQPRRLVFGRGPLPEGSELELRSGRLEDELAELAREDVQSLLLEGGPTLAGAFLRAGLLDKLLVFFAPKLVGGEDAPGLFAGPAVRMLTAAIPLSDLEVERIGADLLVTAYLREP